MPSVTVTLENEKLTTKTVRFDNPEIKSEVVNNLYVGKSVFGVDKSDSNDKNAYPTEVRLTIAWD